MVAITIRGYSGNTTCLQFELISYYKEWKRVALKEDQAVWILPLMTVISLSANIALQNRFTLVMTMCIICVINLLGRDVCQEKLYFKGF